MLSRGFRLDHLTDDPLPGLGFRMQLVPLRLLGLSVSVLLAVCHGVVLQRVSVPHSFPFPEVVRLRRRGPAPREPLLSLI
jgi:hypothetical protein